jgi:hypothetical protein
MKPFSVTIFFRHGGQLTTDVESKYHADEIVQGIRNRSNSEWYSVPAPNGYDLVYKPDVILMKVSSV